MKALVTGGNGFLASNTIRELNRRGIEVRAMVRSSSDLKSLKGTECELFYGNIVTGDDVVRAIKGCDVVIHAAANTSQGSEDYLPYVPVNIRGTLNVLEAAVFHGVKKLIFVSTANTFGYGTKKEPGNEKIPIKYPFTKSGYALSKLRAQELVLDFVQNLSLDAVVVNPTFMIGAYDAKPSSGKAVLMGYQKKTILVPRGGKNFVHVKDVAAGICNALEKGKKGECYLLANENLSFGEFFSKIAFVSGNKQNQINIPELLTTGMGVAGSFWNKVGFSTDLTYITSKMLSLGNYFSANKAVNDLGMPQTTVEDAICDALDWFGRNGYIRKQK